ncbi:glycosyltransferase family 4 protein [Blastomonas sp.]|uniref:glycosyltransferase family 4 protein n=1 Tax=Blastomonas sp. TaxID=1909299 RepID=UPI0035935EE4
MKNEPVGRSVAIFFYAGDFSDVLRRHSEGAQQIYATHDEVARLILDLRVKNVDVTIYSYVTDAAKDEWPMEGVRVVSLGASGANRGVLKAAVESASADTIIAHFSYPELLIAAIKSGKRVFAGLANSYNERGLKQYLRRKRIAHILNNKRIRMVSNHCVPATRHLAEIGVARDKLIAWDVPHRYQPTDYAPKVLTPKDWFQIAYAGSIAERKGVGDLIRAIAYLKDDGLSVRASFAGLGDIESMKALASSLDVGDHVDFRGIVGNELVFEMFREADIVAVPSRTAYPEGFPLTMFEAVASRSPIVCTDHPMFRSILADGDNCTMFKSGDANGFAEAIRRVLSDSILYRTLSESAPTTWEALRGPADWRTLLTRFITEGEHSPWFDDYRLKMT